MDPGHRAELYAERRDGEPPSRLRGLLATVAALLVMGLFAGGLWFAYTQGIRHASSGGGGGDVPLIRADERPTKVKPDKPGGMEIPDRDKLIYTQKRVAVEHLLPAPEKPMARPAAPAAPPVQAAASPPPSAAVTTKPTTPTTLAPAPGTTPEAVAAPAAGTTATRPQQQPAAASSPAKTGGTRLQLGSVRSQDAARHEWDRIKRANSDLLGNLSGAPVRADLGDKGVFYRIQTGPIADADRICDELKRRNIGCIIAR
jgi:hypothetical protein